MTRRLTALLATGILAVMLLIVGTVPSKPAGSQRDSSAQRDLLLAQKKDQNKKKNQNKKKRQNKKSQGQGEGSQASTPGVRQITGQNPPSADFVAALLDEARQAGVSVLSHGDSYDDFPSVAQTSDGTLYAAYAAYYDGHDQIRIHRRLDDGTWSTHSYVPLVEGRPDVWMPQLAVDKNDKVWVIWSEQTDWTGKASGNWDLYARPLEGDKWGKVVRLTDDPKPDINPHVTTDAARNIHVVWQAHPQNNGDVQYCRFDGNTWSKPLPVTSDAASDWYPHVAVDREGTVWIAFDSYRNGDYDVFLTSVSGDKPGRVIPITASSYYEAHASVACTPDGRVWVAWEQGGHNWGKDQGYWLRQQKKDAGTTLGSTRQVKVACWYHDAVYAAPDVADSLPEDTRNQPTAMAELAADSSGRLWLRYRHMIRRPLGGRRGRSRRGWTENITTLTKQGWQPAKELAASLGRISVFSRILPVQDGSLWVAYSGDARVPRNLHRPIHDTAMAVNVPKPDAEPGVPELAKYQEPAPPAGAPQWDSAQEERQVAAIREHRVTINGRPNRIVRGDLHRHSELSWDVGPGNDGSYLDFYRYMIDVAAMDFGGLTDHQGGGHYKYWWWLTEKAADMFYLPPRFVPLYSYERSVRFPNGHRNIFHAYRGVPVFPFQLTLDQRANFPGVGTGSVVENDTKLLYEFLHGTDGIAISHTSGTSSMGTDWRDNDPEIEPVVEIYQGARNSYETLGGPRVHPQDKPPGDAPGGFQEAGMVWNAYAKGYRLGTTASSDHGSTHISYSLVYTPENDREAILDSMRKRHTYGATDNLIVDFQANGHFMGEEFSSTEKPKLSLRVTGTAKIAKVDLIRNNEYIYAFEPDSDTVDRQYTDMEPKEGTNLYYFRVQQEDGQLAWSSPVWVHYQKP